MINALQITLVPWYASYLDPDAPMPRTQTIERHLIAFRAALAECVDLQNRIETERVAVSAITNAIGFANETLVRRGWVSRHTVDMLALSMQENALDLNAALDEVDASIRTAIVPVQAFAQATERIKSAQDKVLRDCEDPAAGAKSASGVDLIDRVEAEHSALSERLLANYRELADKTAHALDDLREKIDRLQTSFAQISATMSA